METFVEGKQGSSSFLVHLENQKLEQLEQSKLRTVEVESSTSKSYWIPGKSDEGNGAARTLVVGAVLRRFWIFWGPC